MLRFGAGMLVGTVSGCRCGVLLQWCVRFGACLPMPLWCRCGVPLQGASGCGVLGCVTALELGCCRGASQMSMAMWDIGAGWRILVITVCLRRVKKAECLVAATRTLDCL